MLDMYPYGFAGYPKVSPDYDVYRKESYTRHNIRQNCEFERPSR